MLLHTAQKEIVSDNHRFRVACCGRRFGKTVLAVEELVFSAVTKKDANIAYLAPTYVQARDIAWELLKKRVNEIEGTKYNESRLELTIPNQHYGYSKIQLRGWESVESMRGQAFDFLILDEVAMYRGFETGWQEVVRPTLTDRRGKVLFISTPKGFNFWYDLFNKENTDKDFKSFHFTSYDNPHLPKDEVDKAKLELTEDRFAQEYLADFRKTEGLVYKEFVRDKHLFDEPGFDGEQFRVVKTFGGVDFGFKNPASVITIKEDSDSNFWVMSEWYKTEQTDAQIADYVSALRWNECYPDPENPGGIAELERRKVNVREVIKNKGSIKNGINIVRELFKSGRLYIHTSCVNLIWELETYSYPDKKDMHNEEENPIKENDHAVDALRYALSMVTHAETSSAVVRRPTYKGYNRH